MYLQNDNESDVKTVPGKSERVQHPSVSLERAPAEVFMYFDAFVSNTETREHSHEWGQIQLISGGILEMEAQSTRFLAPPHLAIWVPAGIMHRSYNRKPLQYCSINIVGHSEHFPSHVSLLSITPIVLSIVEDFRSREVSVAHSEEDKRLVQVLLDQLAKQNATSRTVGCTHCC